MDRLQKNFQKNYERQNFSRNGIRRIVKAVINDNEKVWYQERYAIAKLIAPSIVKKYEEGNISAIKEYLQSTQEGNLKMHCQQQEQKIIKWNRSTI